MNHFLRGKKILIGLSGSISAYRIADLVSSLKKAGAEVQCLMTRSACEFLPPLVLETLSGNRVPLEVFGPDVSGTEHIKLARFADLVVLAPASANLISRLTHGMADDLLTTVALASRAPILVAPAMNTAMWENVVTQENITRLQARIQYRVLATDSGPLACGEEGPGRLLNTQVLFDEIAASLAPKDLAGQTILVTAGPTTSSIDAVRYLTNHSTGKMGVALAMVAASRGAHVHLVLGKDKGVEVPPILSSWNSRLRISEVQTAEEMLNTSLSEIDNLSGIIAAAAVLDYEVGSPHKGKKKRSLESVELKLRAAPDVLLSLRKKAPKDVWFCGFAAETNHLLENARHKLKSKKLDYIFVNRVASLNEKLETGFGSETNAGVLLSKTGRSREIPQSSKFEVANQILGLICSRKNKAPLNLSYASH